MPPGEMQAHRLQTGEPGNVPPFSRHLYMLTDVATKYNLRKKSSQAPSNGFEMRVEGRLSPISDTHIRVAVLGSITEIAEIRSGVKVRDLVTFTRAVSVISSG